MEVLTVDLLLAVSDLWPLTGCSKLRKLSLDGGSGVSDLGRLACASSFGGTGPMRRAFTNTRVLDELRARGVTVKIN